MISRRKFLRTSSLATAGLALPSSKLFSRTPAPYDIGLQIFSLEKHLQKDFVGTLARVASLGYRQVELYDYKDGGYFGLTAKEVKNLLIRFRLRAPSGHYKYGLFEQYQGTVRNGWEKAIEDAKMMGHKYMVIGWLHPTERDRLDKYKKLAEWLNMAGQQCEAAGIQLCYHNHDFEFWELEGEIPYDVLLERTEFSLMKMEMDMYWVTKAGYDPLAYFEKHPGRFPLWHVKDMEKPPETSFTEVGNGRIDFPAIFAQRKLAGMEQFFVEQDKSKGNMFDSIQTSREYLMQMKY